MNTRSRRHALLTSALTLGLVVPSTFALTDPDATIIGKDINSAANPFVQPVDPALSGGGKDQSLKFGDVLLGDVGNDLIIGRLGVDVLVGAEGDDVLLGGTEHFNPENRDRAFGGPGDDVFVWAPGDGSDFFNGGEGIDVLVFGLVGEVVDGELTFGVSNDQLAGDVFVDPGTGLPIVDVTNSPGFCDVLDTSLGRDAEDALTELELDHLVRFTLRSVADDFEAGVQNTDNGLRVTLHLQDVEVVVCATRDGGAIEAINLTTSPPTIIRFERVPVPALQAMVK